MIKNNHGPLLNLNSFQKNTKVSIKNNKKVKF